MKKGQYFMNDETGVLSPTFIGKLSGGIGMVQTFPSGSTALWYAVGVIDKKRRKWK